MDESSVKLLKEKKSFSIKDFLPLKFVYSAIFIIITGIILIVSKLIYESKVEDYKYNIDNKVSLNILKNFEVIYKQKIDSSFVVASALSHNIDIIQALKNNKASKLDLEVVLQDIKIKQEYVDMNIEIIDKGGFSFKRNWTYLAGDNVSDTNPNIKNIIQVPKTKTLLNTTKNGFTITNMIPIYDNGSFLGVLVTYTHLDNFADSFKDQGFNTVIILDEENSKLVYQNQSYSKKFIDNFYIVNSNASGYLLRLIEQNGIENFYKEWSDLFSTRLSNEHMISKFILKDIGGLPKAKMFIFKQYDEINYEDLEIIKKWYITISIFIILVLAFIIYYKYTARRLKDIIKKNSALVIINENLKEKTDLLDYNEKKVENLFNSQPNLMFMHNGKEITDINKRFMGFFNRFKTFDGFKTEHKCVSELFEKYEAPNYISEQYIEGIYWVDYILKNPKRLYKIVMHYKDAKTDEPHHFIVKLNEMHYAGQISERLIIIALVDVTQDLKNYKQLN